MAHINIGVRGQVGVEVYFRMRTTNQLRRLMDAYCDWKSIDINYTRFRFGGRKLQPEQTPEDRGMLDGDEVDVELLILNVMVGNVAFRIKKTTRLRKLMRSYCDRQRVDMSAIGFFYDGAILLAEQTPYELNMEDGDEIDAMLLQPSLFLKTQASEISDLTGYDECDLSDTSF